MTVKEFCKKYNIAFQTVYKKIKRHKNKELAEHIKKNAGSPVELDDYALGYSREMLQMRIENKSLEMAGRKISRYRGWQIDIAVCFKHTQHDFYRIKEDNNYKNPYEELKRNAALLTFLCDNKIRSEKELTDYVNYLDKREKELSEIVKCNNMGGVYNEKAFRIAEKNHERNKAELERISAEKRIAAANYQTYLTNKESDCGRLLKQEKIKREIELYRQGYEISADGKPYKDFKETVLRMAKWAEMVQEKAARNKLQERHYRSR